MNKTESMIIKRYRVRQKIISLTNEVNDLRKLESMLDDYITYNALLLENQTEAERYKKNNIDTKKEGLFNIKVKNGLKYIEEQLKTGGF